MYTMHHIHAPYTCTIYMHLYRHPGCEDAATLTSTLGVRMQPPLLAPRVFFTVLGDARLEYVHEGLGGELRGLLGVNEASTHSDRLGRRHLQFARCEMWDVGCGM